MIDASFPKQEEVPYSNAHHVIIDCVAPVLCPI
jgi:hypothetical protein